MPTWFESVFQFTHFFVLCLTSLHDKLLLNWRNNSQIRKICQKFQNLANWFEFHFACRYFLHVICSLIELKIQVEQLNSTLSWYSKSWKKTVENLQFISSNIYFICCVLFMHANSNKHFQTSQPEFEFGFSCSFQPISNFENF